MYAGCAPCPDRIFNLASAEQAPIAFDNLMLDGAYDPCQAYGQNNLALIGFTFELVQRVPENRVKANCLRPATFIFLDTNTMWESVDRP